MSTHSLPSLERGGGGKGQRDGERGRERARGGERKRERENMQGNKTSKLLSSLSPSYFCLATPSLQNERGSGLITHIFNMQYYMYNYIYYS